MLSILPRLQNFAGAMNAIFTGTRNAADNAGGCDVSGEYWESIVFRGSISAADDAAMCQAISCRDPFQAAKNIRSGFVGPALAWEAKKASLVI